MRTRRGGGGIFAIFIFVPTGRVTARYRSDINMTRMRISIDIKCDVQGWLGAGSRVGCS